MSFNIALSGLQAARSDLDVTANNIANANTAGFKRSRAEFADVFSQAYNGNSSLTPGNGVRLAAITQQFDQGNIENSSSNLDLAVNGQGFFTVRDGGGQLYSRDGAFQVDREGFVVNSSGQRLQAFPALD
ncbi:MAG: flagellar hook-basal body complex protein, partial [Pseudomonadales bacterium]|nr:flagellar hook-basal body complex protein [Pseudomonadales bacterium]